MKPGGDNSSGKSGNKNGSSSAEMLRQRHVNMRTKSGCVIQSVCLSAGWQRSHAAHSEMILMIICTAAKKKKKKKSLSYIPTKPRRMMCLNPTRVRCTAERKTLQRQAELRRFLFVICWLKCSESVAGD